MNQKQTISGTSFFWFVCLVMMLYSSYRYPFQINNSVTSPTYTDTPFALQVGKYFIIMLFTALIIPLRSQHINLRNVTIGLLFTSPVLLLGIIKWGIFAQFEFLQFPLSFCVCYFFVVFLPRIYLPSISSLIKKLFILGVIVDAIQVALFFLYDCLPALAYKNSFSVRFGSFLDDPNGYGILCCLFIGWGYVYYRKQLFRHVFFQLMNILMVLLTQSITALLCMLVVVCVLYYRFWFFWATILIVGSAAAFYSESIYTFLGIFLEVKKGSIDSHLTVKTSHETIFHILFGGEYNQQESWWLSLYVNYGIIFSVLWGVLVLASTFIFLGTKKHKMSLDAESTYTALCCFILAFWVGMLNLPLPLIFPLNFVFFVTLFLAVQKKIIWMMPD